MRAAGRTPHDNDHGHALVYVVKAHKTHHGTMHAPGSLSSQLIGVVVSVVRQIEP